MHKSDQKSIYILYKITQNNFTAITIDFRLSRCYNIYQKVKDSALTDKVWFYNPTLLIRDSGSVSRLQTSRPFRWWDPRMQGAWNCRAVAHLLCAGFIRHMAAGWNLLFLLMSYMRFAYGFFAIYKWINMLKLTMFTNFSWIAKINVV